MKRIVVVLAAAFIAISSLTAFGQGKGVDVQNERIRDQSNDRAPATNGVNQGVGTGRGVDFGRGKTEGRATLSNPFRFTARRDAILVTLEEILRERKMVIDSAASKLDQGLIVSQPMTFTKGAVVSQSELGRYATLPATNSRGWTGGRMTYKVDIEPVDAVTTNVAINVTIEGRTNGLTGSEWVTLESSGEAEQDLLGALVEKITGSLPVK